MNIYIYIYINILLYWYIEKNQLLASMVEGLLSSLILTIALAILPYIVNGARFSDNDVTNSSTMTSLTPLLRRH